MNDRQGKIGSPVSPLSEDEKRLHCLVDRRAGFDRRRAYSLSYFANGGIERRKNQDRRHKNDRRRLWEMRGTPCPGASS